MKKFLLPFLFLSIFLASCENRQSEPSQGEFSKMIDVTAYCRAESGGALKVSLADASAGSVIWNDGDAIKVFNNLGSFSSLSLSEGGGTADAVFTGGVPKGSTNSYYAISPSSLGTSCSAGTVSLTLPSVQFYVSGGFDPSFYPCVSSTSLDGDELDFYFKPATSVVRFGLRGEGSVSSIVLSDKSSHALSGVFSVDASSDKPVLSAVSGQSSVTLVCSDPVALKAGEDTDFYFCVPPGAFSEGLDLEIFDNNGASCKISSVRDNMLSAGMLKYFSAVVAGPFVKPTVSCFDACGNSYPIVTIGTQTWMAENMKCNKYDSESEAYNAIWLLNNSIPTFSVLSYTPFYKDLTDVSLWQQDKFAGNLTSEQISKLGYIYNFSAAVGLADGQYQTSSFSGYRQGICPNGWHVPSNDEWNILFDFVGGSEVAGVKLKTTSGWYKDGNGINEYGFSLLPATTSPGFDAYMISSTSINETSSFNFLFDYYYPNVVFDDLGDGKNKKSGFTVRCLKNL